MRRGLLLHILSSAPGDPGGSFPGFRFLHPDTPESSHGPSPNYQAPCREPGVAWRLSTEGQEGRAGRGWVGQGEGGRAQPLPPLLRRSSGAGLVGRDKTLGRGGARGREMKGGGLRPGEGWPTGQALPPNPALCGFFTSAPPSSCPLLVGFGGGRDSQAVLRKSGKHISNSWPTWLWGHCKGVRTRCCWPGLDSAGDTGATAAVCPGETQGHQGCSKPVLGSQQGREPAGVQALPVALSPGPSLACSSLTPNSSPPRRNHCTTVIPLCIDLLEWAPVRSPLAPALRCQRPLLPRPAPRPLPGLWEIKAHTEGEVAPSLCAGA